ncbi:TlpA family protein disulfide reductase [Mucilaginibacter sp. ZT4R22]|uniref:TlpA family protein disulfide reductase n=1 Tax=Mucilaginibacter pankratovii TaxID=2772110 RepID=A0ABR7WNZ2_9SPHI|nr:TlpA disulfide reductase family protein [Mucilaginibacter pankratovii]MBD1364036.1 TlpA family protein disulfide reductase [Mucilaginibacter pankratovii]
MKFYRLILCVFFLFSCFINSAVAQKKSRPLTKFDKQRENELIKLVNKTPHDLGAHEKFLNFFNVIDSPVMQRYDRWLSKDPQNAIAAFAIGKALQRSNNSACERYLLKAVAIDTALAPAWYELSLYQYGLNNKKIAQKYLSRAKSLEAKNVNYAFLYALSYRDENKITYDSLLIDLASRFPNSEKAAEALYFAAGEPINKNVKSAYFEALLKMDQKAQLPWVNVALQTYFEELLGSNPEEAFNVALQMSLKINTNRDLWKKRLQVARSFIETRKLLNENAVQEALATIKKASLGNSKILGITIDAEEGLTKLKAEVMDAAGQTREGIDTLMALYSVRPSKKIYGEMLRYAKKLEIDSCALDKLIYQQFEKNAWQPTNFSLRSYIDNQQISLSDYKGKVVLLTYWFPGCFPCLAEFPKFEKVLQKFDKKQVVYLAINLNNIEENHVLPIRNNGGYTFIPLRDEPNNMKGNLPRVFSAPTNYLFDGKGRVIFSDFFINDRNQEMLEEMITKISLFNNVGL